MNARRRDTARYVMLLLAFVGGTTMPALAQDPLHRVIHLWVDPHYGDNAAAVLNNPSCQCANQDCTVCTVGTVCVATPNCANPSGRCQFWPNDHMAGPTAPNNCCANLNIPTEILLHAPWPFRTITGAIAYLTANDPSCMGGPAVIPMGGYRSPRTNRTWRYAIIHLLPGWYARDNVPLFTRYTHNGLYPNGETFPIDLPDGVSVQGTSALNVVFDLTAAEEPWFGLGPAFRFGFPGGPYAANGKDSFIDSVSIFGGFKPAHFDARNNSAIYIVQDPEPEPPAVTPTVTNCFLFGNGVGILVDTPGGTTTPNIRATIVNNTIAMNGVGLWNGQLPNDGTGLATLNVINNIFDSSPFDDSLQTGQSLPPHWPHFAVLNPAGTPYGCFEGVTALDLEVLAVPPSTFLDYNAYERNPGRFNTGVAYPWLALPVTTPRAVGPSVPGVDITSYTDGGGIRPRRRGTLYVRDLLSNGVTAGAPYAGPFPGFDRSPGDFRLSPDVAPSADSPVAPTTFNPCVDAGWSAWPATMRNNTVVPVPGRLPLVFANGSWVFDYLKNDCEGYGNPRSYRHPLSPPCPLGPCHHTDIGADELGEGLAIGSRFGTTYYIEDRVQFPNGFYNNQYIWWLGPVSAIHGPPPNTNMRPYYIWSWPFPGTPTCWDYSYFGSPCGTVYYRPGSVDITPHLIPDGHPWWQLPIGGPSSGFWQCWKFCGGSLFNQFLYMQPLAGVANPPGTYLGGTVGTFSFSYLDTGAAPPTGPNLFGPFGGGPATFQSFGAWCEAKLAAQTMGNPDTMTQHPVATRYSVEFANTTPFNGVKNIQSFMVWNNLP